MPVASSLSQRSPSAFRPPNTWFQTPPFPGPYPDQPVQLCCEILSPEDRLGSMLGKCEEYHSWGVPYCWVIDPVKRTAWQYEAGGEPFRVTDSLSAGSINIPLLELFANLEEGHE
jgi:Uma2 family endonuclease